MSNQTQPEAGSVVTPDLTEFNESMQGLEAFSKAHASSMAKGMAYNKPAEMTPEEEEAAKKKAEEEEGEALPGEPLGKSAAAPPADGEDPNAMNAEEFLNKANVLLGKTVETVIVPQQHALLLMAKGLVEHGKVLKSLSGVGEELASLREELVAQGQLPHMRKSTLTLHERQPSGAVNPSPEPTGAEVPKQLLAKAHGVGGLLAKGVLSPEAIGILERCSNRNEALPPHMGNLAQFASDN